MTKHEKEAAKASYDFCIEVSNHVIVRNPTFDYDHLQLTFQKGAEWEKKHILKLINLHIKDKESFQNQQSPFTKEYIDGMKDVLAFLQKRLQLPGEKDS